MKIYIRYIKEGTWIAVGQLITVFCSLYLVKLLTNNLTPSNYGIFSLGLTVVGLINQILYGGLNNGISRFYSIADEQNDLKKYFKDSLNVGVKATFILLFISLIICCCALIFKKYQWIAILIAALILSFFSGINNIFNGIQNSARQRLIVAIHTSADSIIKILLILLIGSLLKLNVLIVFACYSFSLIVINISQLFFIKRLIPNRINIDSNNQWEKKIIQFSWPFVTWGLFTWAQQSSDRWALEHFNSVIDVGLYTVIYQLGYVPISLVTTFIISFISPILFQKAGDGTNSERKNKTDLFLYYIVFASLVLTILGFIITFLLNKLIFELFVSASYSSISYLLPWIVLAGGIFATGQIISIKQLTDMDTKKLIPVKIITSIIGVFLNIIFARALGIIGVVIAQVIFSFIYTIWMFVLVRMNAKALILK